MSIILSEIKPDGGESAEQSYDKAVLRIGRDPVECDIAFDKDIFPMVSRKHAELRSDDGKWFLVDLNASYGTYLDGRRVAGTERVHAGQTLQFGNDGPRLRVVWFEVFTESVPPVVSPEPVRPVVQPPPVVVQPAAAAPIHQVNPFNAPQPAAPVAVVPPKPAAMDARLAFVGEPGRPPFVLSMQGISIGRDPACDINFDPMAVMVSRKHATLRFEGGQFVLEDNGSFNGTYVNDHRIAAATPLYHQDILRFGIGGPLLEFVSPSRPAPSNAGFAGQRSVADANVAGSFQIEDDGL
jgi:pSer/pThr/pTyr-binding forkhead associated (FHA) protein